MQIKNLRLNPVSMQQLYGSALVLKEKKGHKPQKNINTYLGDNHKGIVITVHEPAAVHITDVSLALLTTILQACKLSLQDVAIFNTAHNPVQWGTVQALVSMKTLILFGINPTVYGMPILFEEYHVQAYAGVTCIYSHSIQDIATNKSYKAQLWTALKKAFAI